ncbi:MAG TPA: sulfotransferase [Gammaproteobacteria bacterium]
MTLQVLGVGFGRTGTLSLKAALETLGIGPCYHMVEVAARPKDAPIWAAAARGEAVDWRALLAGFAAVADWPATAFWRELLAAFPTARVVLTVRDSTAWHASFRDTVLDKASGPPPPQDSALRAVYDLTRELILDGVFGGRAADVVAAISTYEAHNRAVIESVPPERLLVFDPATGWEPLCRFLARPVPPVPFPHLNTRAGFLREYLGPRAAARLAGVTRS